MDSPNAPTPLPEETYDDLQVLDKKLKSLADSIKAKEKEYASIQDKYLKNSELYRNPSQKFSKLEEIEHTLDFLKLCTLPNEIANLQLKYGSLNNERIFLLLRKFDSKTTSLP